MKIFVNGITRPIYNKKGEKFSRFLEFLKLKKPKSDREIFDEFSGKLAGICYMPENWNALVNESHEKTMKRSKMVKKNTHHSCFDHEWINLYLEDIPKALAMVINNEKFYTTSEKSARYTKMVLKEDEQKLYDKWLSIFEKLIAEKYQLKYPKFFNGSRITKLAQENARYLISVFTPTSMEYTVSYRQLNYMYNFMMAEIERENQNRFYKLLTPAMKEFCDAIEKTGFIDSELKSNKLERKLSLYDEQKPVEYFGDVYVTSYKGSFAQLAQAQRHRTLDYTMSLLDNYEFFVPPIIASNPDLVSEWKNDCKTQSHVFPQGLLVNINESGKLERFIEKMEERKCTYAQLEINKRTEETLKKFVARLEKSNHPKAEVLREYTKGSRCTFPTYKCEEPCGFAEGINETREI